MNRGVGGRVSRFHQALNERLFDCGGYVRCYQELITEVLDQPDPVLHLGSGDGVSLNRPAEVSGPDSRFISLDLDPEALAQNPSRLRVLADATALPFKDGRFGAVCSEHLLEHLSSPARVFRESRRVLRSGGRFIFATPNGWSYVALLARVIPLPLRARLVALGSSGSRQRHFRTYYLANTVFAIPRLAKTADLEVECLRDFVGEPRYTLGVPLVHVLAVAWHRILERLGLSRWFGMTLVGVLTKR